MSHSHTPSHSSFYFPPHPDESQTTVIGCSLGQLDWEPKLLMYSLLLSILLMLFGSVLFRIFILNFSLGVPKFECLRLDMNLKCREQQSEYNCISYPLTIYMGKRVTITRYMIVVDDQAIWPGPVWVLRDILNFVVALLRKSVSHQSLMLGILNYLRRVSWVRYCTYFFMDRHSWKAEIGSQAWMNNLIAYLPACIPWHKVATSY